MKFCLGLSSSPHLEEVVKGEKRGERREKKRNEVKKQRLYKAIVHQEMTHMVA